MYEYSQSCLEEFLKRQGKLFDEPVAETLEEAEEFLEDCMAVGVDSLKEVCDYLEESGMDINGLSLDEIRELEEVFELEDGTYLIVEAYDADRIGWRNENDKIAWEKAGCTAFGGSACRRLYRLRLPAEYRNCIYDGIVGKPAF